MPERGDLLALALPMKHNNPVSMIQKMIPADTIVPVMTDEQTKIDIRSATMDDAERIAEFNRRLAWETEKIRLAPEIVDAGVRAMIADPTKGRYFVATTSNQVIGQIMHTYEWSDWRNGSLWWIQSVYVDAQFRGRGVFRALFEHLQREARHNEGVGLRLYVEEENRVAQEVYHKLGMTHAGYHVLELPLVNRFADG